MKCFHVALVLLLVFAGRTTGVAAANEDATVASQEGMLLTPAWREIFRQSPAYTSPAGNDADQFTADVFTGYDAYYANTLCRSGSSGKDSACTSSSPVAQEETADGATLKVRTALAFGARVCCCAKPWMSSLAAYSETAAVYASECWNETVASICERATSRDETGLAVRSRMGETVAPGGELPESIERVYVTSCRSSRPILATLGKPTAEYRMAPPPQATLLGEFYTIDAPSCPAFVTEADFAALSQASAEEAIRGGRGLRADSKDRTFADSVIGTIRSATWLGQWTAWWMVDWDVVFRNISRQIARLDWTIVLTGRPSDLTVRNMASGSGSVER
jgi:hypothetical protein